VAMLSRVLVLFWLSCNRPVRVLAHLIATLAVGLQLYRVAKKSKSLPNDQKIVLNRIKTCEWNKIYSST